MMHTLINAFRRVPLSFQLIFRWLGMCLYLAVLALVLVLIARIVISIRENSGGWLFHPQPHQPMSPDFIHYHLSLRPTIRRISED